MELLLLELELDLELLLVRETELELLSALESEPWQDATAVVGE